MNWKKGRGKLGVMAPLFGSWITNKGNIGFEKPQCTRVFEKALDGKYIQLKALWYLGDKIYKDHTLFGVNADKELCFWSFTSDGKQAHGKLANATDIHPEAIAFEAQMPGGLARQIYWPHPENGFYWAVESKTKKGWNRFVKQHYVEEA